MIQFVLEVLIGGAIIAFIIVRQFHWTAFDESKMWRSPVVLAVAGVVLLLQAVPLTSLRAVDWLLLGVQAVAAVGTGALIGKATLIRVSSANAMGDENKPHRFEVRAGGLGVLFLLVMVGVRVAGAVASHALGSPLASAAGVIVAMLALNRLGRNLVLAGRFTSRETA